MKYLLILLFFFSTHSFTEEVKGEADGKGIDCDISRKREEYYIENKSMWWFNNGRTDLVEVIGQANKVIVFPSSKYLKKNDVVKGVQYFSTAGQLIWSTTFETYKLSRRELTISITDKNRTKLLGTGICKVFIGFKEVLKRQKELKRKAKEKERKAREGNKI